MTVLFATSTADRFFFVPPGDWWWRLPDDPGEGPTADPDPEAPRSRQQLRRDPPIANS